MSKRRNRKKQRKTEIRSQSLAGFIQHMQDGNSAAGVRVDAESATTVTAVYCACSIISSAVSGLPRHIFLDTDSGKDRNKKHPLYRMLNLEPNHRMSAFSLFSGWVWAALTTGNGYLYVNRPGSPLSPSISGEVEGIYPMLPSKVEVVPLSDDKGIVYKWQREENSGEAIIIHPSKVLHLHTIGMDGINGISPIEKGKTSIGIMLAADKFSARYWTRSARPDGHLESKDEVTDKVFANLNNIWVKPWSKDDQIPVLEEGIEFKPTSLSPEKSQYIQSRVFGVKEVARLYQIPAFMLGEADSTTYNNGEHLSIGFLRWTLNPWLVRIEQELNRKLFADDEHYMEFITDALLRSDTKTRYEAHNLAILGGWKSPNEVRVIENMNTKPGLDFFTIPMSQWIIDGDGGLLYKANKSESTKDADTSKDAPDDKAKRNMLNAALNRCLRVETNAINKKLRKFLTTDDIEGFSAWVETFYNEHRGKVKAELSTVFDAFNMGDADKVVESVVTTARGEIRSILKSDNAWTQLGQRVKAWKEDRADQLTNTILGDKNNG